MFQPRIPGSIGLTKGRVDPVCSRFGLVKGSGVNPMNHETGPHALASIPFSFSLLQCEASGFGVRLFAFFPRRRTSDGLMDLKGTQTLKPFFAT